MSVATASRKLGRGSPRRHLLHGTTRRRPTSPFAPTHEGRDRSSARRAGGNRDGQGSTTPTRGGPAALHSTRPRRSSGPAPTRHRSTQRPSGRRSPRHRAEPPFETAAVAISSRRVVSGHLGRRRLHCSGRIRNSSPPRQPLQHGLLRRRWVDQLFQKPDRRRARRSPNLSAQRRLDAGQHAQQCGLAGTIRADQADGASADDRQIDSLGQQVRAMAEGHPRGDERGHHRDDLRSSNCRSMPSHIMRPSTIQPMMHHSPFEICVITVVLTVSAAAH